MLEIRHQLSLAQDNKVAFTPRPIEPGKPPARPAAQASERWFSQRYVNAAQNGRLPVALPSTTWRSRWTIDVSPVPMAVLRDKDRIVVQGGGWRLLGVDGHQLAEGPGGPSSFSLDEGAQQFYLINTTSYLEAHALSTGDLVYQSPLLTNERFVWPLVVNLGKRLLMAGVEQPAAGHTPRPGTRSEVDMLEFAPKFEVDEYKQILSLTRGEILHVNRPEMIFAAANDTIYAAAPDYLIVAGGGLDVRAVFQGQFKPLWLSVDESGYMYLIVEAGGILHFWVVSPEGKRVVQVTLAKEQQDILQPPIVGYDHRVYLAAMNTILAFNADGSPAWQHAMQGPIGGAAVTPDHKLLVAAGSELAILDAQGQTIGEQRFPGEALTTVPVLTQDGLLIGSQSRVHSLVANGK